VQKSRSGELSHVCENVETVLFRLACDMDGVAVRDGCRLGAGGRYQCYGGAISMVFTPDIVLFTIVSGV
jgi:hypothetical protein